MSLCQLTSMAFLAFSTPLTPTYKETFTGKQCEGRRKHACWEPGPGYYINRSETIIGDADWPLHTFFLFLFSFDIGRAQLCIRAKLSRPIISCNPSTKTCQLAELRTFRRLDTLHGRESRIVEYALPYVLRCALQRPCGV